MTVIILGSEGVLGSALVQKYQSDMDVIGVDYHPITRHDGISYYCVDFSSKTAITRLFDEWDIDGRSPLYLISALGYFGEDYRKNRDPIDAFYRAIQINLTGVGHACVSLLNLRSLKDVRIVLIGSAAAEVGSRDIGYGTAKAGLNGLVISLSKCFAEQGHRIMGVCPGIFESSMSTSVTEDRQLEAVRSTHVKRKGMLSEIINVVDYATFHAPQFLTGTVISVSGGQVS